MNSPRRKPLRRCHDVIEFRLAEVRAKCLNAPGELRVNHPAVKYSQTFKTALANLIQHQRGQRCLTFNQNQRHRPAIQPGPFQRLVDAIPKLKLIEPRFQNATAFRVYLTGDPHSLFGHIVRFRIDCGANNPGGTISPLDEQAVAAGIVRPVGRCSMLVRLLHSDTGNKVIVRIRRGDSSCFLRHGDYSPAFSVLVADRIIC